MPLALEPPPEWIARIFVTALGLILGSFVNVIVHRVPRGMSVVTPRSACPSCGGLIRWWENVPVLSWILLRARCARCAAPIHWRYPLVEATCGLLFLAAHAVFGWSLSLPIALLLVVMVVALIFTDLEHFLLPDALTLPGTFAGLALSFVSPLADPANALMGVLVAVVLVEGSNLAYRLVRGMDGFGAGDTKMLMLVGAFLGWQGTVFTFVAGTFVGVAIGVPLAAWSRWRHPPRADDEELPHAEPAATGEAPSSGSWRELLPRTVAEAAPVLVLAALGAAFLAPWTSPGAALAGVLVGIAFMSVLDAIARRRGRDWPATALLPLAGALAGLPPTRVSAAVAAGVTLAAWASGRAGFASREPPSAPPNEREEEPLPEAESFMQVALPFGVFLGVGALIALLAMDPLLQAYLGAADAPGVWP